jgi:hypothetical protein
MQPRNDLYQIPMMCSIIEDAHRKNAVLARAKESVEIIFPIGADAYKDFFLLRDGPRETPTGKRNPILHWVKKHIRHVSETKAIEVKNHCRGINEVVINGMSLSIEFNKQN